MQGTKDLKKGAKAAKDKMQGVYEEEAKPNYGILGWRHVSLPQPIPAVCCSCHTCAVPLGARVRGLAWSEAELGLRNICAYKLCVALGQYCSKFRFGKVAVCAALGYALHTVHDVRFSSATLSLVL